MSEKIKVAVLGATGSVGQKFIDLLTDHPWFELAEIAASERSAGKKYSEAVNWIMQSPLRKNVADMIVKKTTPEEVSSRVVFSAMDASVAGEVETSFAQAGRVVISNSKNHRYDKDVPLIVPEVNFEHLNIIKKQSTPGCIITNPNCSIIGLMLALKPIHDAFGLELVNVVTMQAVSGAGYPGVSSLDIIDNVIPFIGGEEPKMELEPLKILGEVINGEFKYADIKVSAQCNRVAVIDGHTECVQVKLKKQASEKQMIEAWRNFESLPQSLNLPSAPKPVIHYFDEEKYPQPKIHKNLGKGMAASVGRLRKCPLFDYKFVILSHNTVRGAAGGTLLIAELMKAQGLLEKYL